MGHFLTNPRILSAILAILTFLSFSPALFNDYTNWDDPVYILENPLVRDPAPLSARNIQKIFTSSVHGSYLPLSTLSYAVEYHFVKFNPQISHTVNILIHVGNALLVFWLIYLLSNHLPAAFLTALLFAICPLRVESVAWLAQRKDVLYVFFSLWGLLSYLKHLQSTQQRFLFLTLILFVLALLSKPQAVIFPALLVLVHASYSKKSIHLCIKDKLLFFLLSIIFLAASLKAISPELAHQSTAGIFSIQEKLFLTAFGTFLYILKSIFPFYLSGLYPFPSNIAGHFPWTVYTATIVLLGCSILVYKRIKNDQLLKFGFLWFLAGIALPLGNIWVGGYFICDHYTYLASAGLYLAIALWICRIFTSTSNRAVKEWSVALGSIYILLMMGASVNYCLTWKNSETLWSNTLDSYPDLPIAYNNRAAFYMSLGILDKAFSDTNKAIALVPNAVSFYNRSVIYSRLGNAEASKKDLEEAYRLDPSMKGLRHDTP